MCTHAFSSVTIACKRSHGRGRRVAGSISQLPLTGSTKVPLSKIPNGSSLADGDPPWSVCVAYMFVLVYVCASGVCMCVSVRSSWSS